MSAGSSRASTQAWAEAAPAVGGPVALQVALEHGPGTGVCRLRLRPAATRAYPRRVVLQIFRQIEDIGLDLVVDRVPGRVGRMAQRDDELPDAAPFQPVDLLGDERLGQAWITFDEDCCAGHGHFRGAGRFVSLVYRQSGRSGAQGLFLVNIDDVRLDHPVDHFETTEQVVEAGRRRFRLTRQVR